MAEKMLRKYLILMYMENKKDYAAPMIKLFEVRPQQVLCLSAPGFEDGGDIPYND